MRLAHLNQYSISNTSFQRILQTDVKQRHTARSGYFATNAILGTAASTIHERLRNKDIPENGFTQSIFRSQVLSRLVLETTLAYEQDYNRISNEKKYKLPYDMYERTEQLSPIFALQQTGLFVQEAVGT